MLRNRIVAMAVVMVCMTTGVFAEHILDHAQRFQGSRTWDQHKRNAMSHREHHNHDIDEKHNHKMNHNDENMIGHHNEIESTNGQGGHLFGDF